MAEPTLFHFASLASALCDAGYASPDAWHRKCSAVLGWPVEMLRDLTPAERERVIAALADEVTP